jgi:hypothetical protein
LLDAFARASGQRSLIYAADLRADAPALKAAGRSFLLPAYTDPEYSERLLDLISIHRPAMLFPLHDYELIRLAALRKLIEDLGTRLMLPSSQRLIWSHEWPVDQLPSLRPIPGWIDPREALSAVSQGLCHFPLLLKPRLGSASLYMKRVDGPGELMEVHRSMCEQLPDFLLRLRYAGDSAVGEHTNAAQNLSSDLGENERIDAYSGTLTDNTTEARAGFGANSSPFIDLDATPCSLNRHESILIQPFIEDAREWGFDVLGDIRGNVVDVWVKQKLEMRHGCTYRALPVCRPDLTEVGFELGEWMGHTGNLDIDVLSDADGTLWLADVNPRFGGGYLFSDRFGARYPEYLLGLKLF